MAARLPPPLPARAGVGLKPEHYRAVLDSAIDGLWLEVHPENYMVAGGPRLAWLDALRGQHSLSFHGVGASLGGPDPLDGDHLHALKQLIDRFEPASVSEHVAWCAAGGRYFADLFPLPRTDEALCHLSNRIDAFQTALGRTILIENPSVYLPLKSEMDEPDWRGTKPMRSVVMPCSLTRMARPWRRRCGVSISGLSIASVRARH